ncbi:hypothetical protein Taro_034221 [Colocasia esculenta]|uniref:RING-type domain-containing protein n=1 Tax=Colocasia esculenta TaxID=4460 RepID=A0A843W9C2_COLES|nr:hypothetical protein [Colocasia esculenta]
MGFTAFPCAASAAITPSHCRRNSSSSRKVPRKPATIDEATAEKAGHDQTQVTILCMHFCYYLVLLHPTDLRRCRRRQQQQSICVICLEPLVVSERGGGGSGGQAIFTAQCMHSFHFTCISSVVDHGGVTCPICRAEWAQLPCNLPALPCHQQGPPADPVLRFLNDSIANVRTYRSPSLPSALYDDDDPVEPVLSPARPRLHISLTSLPTLPAGRTPSSLFLRRRPMQQHHSHFVGSSWVPSPQQGVQSGAWLSARLSHRQATDVVVVVSPNGPHVQLLRQSMALVVFSLRPVDRLAIVAYSAVTATRALPLRRMTSRGKRMALQAVDRVFYLGEADPYDGLKKGAKVLVDRAYQNPLSCILHLSDSPTLVFAGPQRLEVPFPVHHFLIGFGLVASSGFVMYEFKEFLSRLLGDVIRETQMRIGEEGRTVTLGELRVGEERRIPLALAGDRGFLRVGYSFVEGGAEECLRTGEVVVGVAEKDDGSVVESGAGRSTDMLLVGQRGGDVEWWASPHPFS